MDDLIISLRDLTAPSRAVDIAIWHLFDLAPARIGGLIVTGRHADPETGDITLETEDGLPHLHCGVVPHFTADLGAALSLRKSGQDLTLGNTSVFYAVAENQTRYQFTGDSPVNLAIAVCMAIIAARDV